MLFAPLTRLLGLVAAGRSLASQTASNNDSIYEESLVLHPLADGKLSVLFRFHTKAHDGKPHLMSSAYPDPHLSFQHENIIA